MLSFPLRQIIGKSIIEETIDTVKAAIEKLLTLKKVDFTLSRNNVAMNVTRCKKLFFFSNVLFVNTEKCWKMSSRFLQWVFLFYYSLYSLSKYFTAYLIHPKPMVHFNTPEKHQKTSSLLIFSGGVKNGYWLKMG